MGEITPPVPLGAIHEIAAFDCGNPVLTAWLQRHALRNEGKGSRTYVACDGDRVVGYYSLAAGHVERKRAPSNLARNMPDPIPIFVLGRLAVDLRAQGRGSGAGLLKDALRRCLTASREIGARAILVHAVDDKAAAFYLQYGFKAFPEEPRTLFLPMGDIVTAL